jgi:hypothetical protein
MSTEGRRGTALQSARPGLRVAPDRPKPPGNPLAWVSLVLGMLGVLLSWAPITASVTGIVAQELVSLALSIAAAALGWFALRQVRVRGAGHRSLALAGAAVGITGVVVLVLPFPWLILN